MAEVMRLDAKKHKKGKLGISNQMVGVLPVLLFMLLTSYFSYVISFILAAIFCVVSISLFFLFKDRFFQFMLFPSATALIMYSVLMVLELEPILFIYSPLLIELLLVISLSLFILMKRPIMKRIRLSMSQSTRKAHLRLSISEFFYIAPILQNLYTIHLFSVLIFTIMPDSMKNIHFEYIFVHDFGILIGLGLLFYEHIRLKILSGTLRKETWLPVLNEQGQVVGRIAQSISMRLSGGRFRHPVVRVAVLYDGKVYLTKRGKEERVCPEMLDFPIRFFIPYKKTVEQALKERIDSLFNGVELYPRFLIRYSDEDENAKVLVSLHVLNIQTEEQFQQLKKQMDGKLWTVKQIEEELGGNLFSKYFLHEFPYLQSTVLIAEQYACQRVSMRS